MIDASASGVLKHRSGSESIAQALRRLEHSALLPPDILAEDDRLVVSLHHLAEGTVDGGDHVDLVTGRWVVDSGRRFAGLDHTRVHMADGVGRVRCSFGGANGVGQFALDVFVHLLFERVG